MVRVNALLPYELAEICHETGARMIHVTTDCVFSGAGGRGGAYNHYRERDVHDSSNFYGRTKSMGEVLHDKRVLNLRCSIVGPEPRIPGKGLLGWFLSHPRTNPILGFGDHLWNGVTTLALAKVIQGIVLNADDLKFASLPRIHHLVPKGEVSKAALLELFAAHFGKPSKIEVHNVGGVDRTLGTSHPDLNKRLWRLAGYGKPPRIEEMIRELSRWVDAGNYPFSQEVSQ